MLHDHDHRPPADLDPAFRRAVGVNVGYLLIEANAALLTGSLAFLAVGAGKIRRFFVVVVAAGAPPAVLHWSGASREASLDSHLPAFRRCAEWGMR